jgi:RNA recognition motif-containing protein
MVKIFVGGFPLGITELELVMLVSPHGTVSTIKIVRDKKTRKCKGYAFLEMEDRTGAENAVEMLDGTAIGDRVLSVSIKEDEPVKPVAPKRYTSNFSRPVQRQPNGATEERKKRPRKQL